MKSLSQILIFILEQLAQMRTSICHSCNQFLSNQSDTQENKKLWEDVIGCGQQ